MLFKCPVKGSTGQAFRRKGSLQREPFHCRTFGAILQGQAVGACHHSRNLSESYKVQTILQGLTERLLQARDVDRSKKSPRWGMRSTHWLSEPRATQNPAEENVIPAGEPSPFFSTAMFIDTQTRKAATICFVLHFTSSDRSVAARFTGLLYILILAPFIFTFLPVFLVMIFAFGSPPPVTLIISDRNPWHRRVVLATVKIGKWEEQFL